MEQMVGGSSFPPKLRYFCLLLGVRNAGTESPLCDGIVVVAGALLGRAPGKHGYVGGAVAVKPFYPPRPRLLQVLEDHQLLWSRVCHSYIRMTSLERAGPSL